MIKVLLVLLCTVASIVQGQKISVGLIVSPDYDYRILKDNSSGDPNVPLIINSRNTFEIPKLGFTSGVNVRYAFTNLFSIETGVQYSNKGYQTEDMQLIYGNMIDPQLGYTGTYAPNDVTSARFIYNMHHIDFPAITNFSLGSKAFRFCVTAGLTTNIFLKEKQTNVFTYVDGHTSSKQTDTPYQYNSVNLTSVVGLGFEWQINPLMLLKVQPTYRNSMLKIINDPITGYLLNVGLNTGFYLGI